MAGKLSPTDLSPGGVSVTPVPGSSPDKPNFPQPLGSTAPARAPASDWADNLPHESDGPWPTPDNWKQ
jgi:hypothetical protein